MIITYDATEYNLSAEDLINLGFEKDGNGYFYQVLVKNGEFLLKINVTDKINHDVIDVNSDDVYFLYKLNDLHSGYAYEVKMEVEETIRRIFDPFLVKRDTNFSVQFSFLEKYVHDQFNDTVEPPFKDDFAMVFRHPRNNKWYGLFIFVHPSKIGLEGTSHLPVLLLRSEKGKASELIDHEKVFPAYHMNKQNWVTIPLDRNCPDDELLSLLLSSRNIVGS